MQPLCVEGVSSASAPGSCESESGAGPSTNPSSSCSEDTETGSTLTYEGGGYEGSGLNFTRSDSLNLARSDSSEVGGFGFIPSDMSMIRADSESLMRGDSDAFTDSQMLSSTMPIDDGQEDDGCIIPAVSSTSSPHGSRLLSRKIRSQNAAKAQLAAAQRQLEAACATPPPPPPPEDHHPVSFLDLCSLQNAKRMTSTVSSSRSLHCRQSCVLGQDRSERGFDQCILGHPTHPDRVPGAYYLVPDLELAGGVVWV
mmetsp:Transcript_6899/g.13292  ORF Transcript_6899/g.13292 Transcript_6899/m.13292 type:complete len:255 (+) Transcript_6899:271-1035(+)